MTSVALVRCSSYEQSLVNKAIEEAIELLGGIDNFVKNGDSVLIKPNLLRPDPPEKATTTHPSVVRKVIELVREAGGKPIIGDSPAFGGVKRAARGCGIEALAAEMKVKVVDTSSKVAIVSGKPGQSLERFKISGWVAESDVVINLPKLKVHRQMQFTAAIKNNFGCVPGKKKARLHLTHGHDREMFAKMLLEYCYHVIKPNLTLIDGIVAMERTGPQGGDPRKLEALICGVDVVALDRVVCEIIGMPTDEVAFMRVAKEFGFGQADLSKISMLGESLEDLRVSDFKFARLIPVTFSPLRIIKSTIKDFIKKVA